MKYLVLILSMSILISAEMEVDGNLTVTDTIYVTTIKSSTIDSLLSLIAQLEMRIAQLETQIQCQNNGIIPDGYCDCYGNVLDVCGECGGDAESEDECSITDIDGNTYEIVTIGDQVWMAENLTTSRYNDNSPIPYVSGASDWGLLTTGAYSNYGNDPNIANINGKLYNWFAVEDYRGICPVGWHVPNDTDFMQLEIVLGMHDEDALNTNWRGGEDDIGSMLASNSNLWDNGLLEMSESFDESGIKVIPAGVRWDTGVFNGQLNSAYFWTSSLYNSNPYAWYRHLSYNNTAVMRTDTFAKAGMSIRCIKD